ncbi:M20/M25/M40 family metallo-hydrolase [Singulisphaera sp. PoT]|uniref:M20/M25/M40 family metallo-hydrolase n=1 Tax=Singulisphaera sp. PoT TaxID=3411797 RepID=UPI003BF5DD86
MPQPFATKAAALLLTMSLPLSLSLVGHAYAQQPAATVEPPAKDKDKEKPKEEPKPEEAKKESKPEEKKEAKPSERDPIDRIKEEGLKHSQVMTTLSYLTDVIGPRLTGSPGMKRANEWTRGKLGEWGLENAHLESWGPFGRGWTLKRFSAQVVEPQCIPLIAFSKAWSPGTDGPLVAQVVYLNAQNEADLAKHKGKLKGAIVLTSRPRNLAARFEPLATRLSDKELLDLADAPEPGTRRRPPANQGGPGAPNATNAPANGQPASAENRDEPSRPRPNGGAMEFARKRLQFLIDEGAALLIDPSTNGDGGTLFVSSASVPNPGGTPKPGAKRISAWDKDVPKIPPQIVVASEHYNRLVRMIEQGESIKVSVDLGVEFHGDDLMAYNTVAEIPGTDLKDQVVMLGGHLDSWHSGTGATDNAAGVAVSMEAVRILKTLDLKPRRTIRIGLWSGEEQGLHGSRAFVTQHFGKAPSLPDMGGPRPSTPEEGKASSESSQQTKAEFDGFSAYFNLDNGSGKIRGVYLQGNEAARPIFRKWLQPFREMGAATLSISNTGGTDHLSFDGIGLPGFQFIQDEIEYDTRTHHSNQDVYDRLQADDMKQASVIMAAFVYNTAMLDEKFPRKPQPETKPAPPAATPPATPAAAGAGGGF